MTSLSISTNETTDECKLWITNLVKLLNTTIPLVWMCVGTCTNILSLIVFSRANLRSNSTFFYLTLMTASDLIVIWLSSFRDFMVYKYDFYVSGWLACKLHVFSFFLFAQFSSWMLAAASFDRLVLVVSSHTSSLSKLWCTKQTAIRFSFFLFVLFFSLNLHLLINVSSMDTHESTASSNATAATVIHPVVYRFCKAKSGFYSHFYTKYYSWIDSFTYSFLPFLIMCVCNYMLIKKVFNSKRNLYKKNGRTNITNNNIQLLSTDCQNEQELALLPADNNTAEQENSTSPKQAIVKFSVNTVDLNSANVLSTFQERSKRLSCISIDPFALQHPLNNSNSNSNSTNNLNGVSSGGGDNASVGIAVSAYKQASKIPLSSMEKMRNMALTIIGVTILFIIFTVPVNIYVPIMQLRQTKDDPNVKECDDLIFCVLNNMVNANHSTSFFIYFTTNFKFKAEIKTIWTNLISQIGFKKETERQNARSLSFSRVSTQDKY